MNPLIALLKDNKAIVVLIILGVGGYTDMADVLREVATDQVIFAVQKRFIAEAEKAIYDSEIQGVETWVVTDFFKTSIARLALEDFAGLPVMRFSTTPEYSWELLFKSVIDRVGAGILLLLTSPILVITLILIKITSPGPIFYKQRREGFHGKPFTLYKFRSMVSNAEQLREELEMFNEMDQIVFKMQDDPRITPVGKWLRKLSIDELPQLINVFLGDMSLVGPRPMLKSEIDEFQEWQRRKLSVKPGITCLWQISGRSETTFEEWMRLDLEYIDHWSLWLDITILLKTVPAVIFARGAK